MITKHKHTLENVSQPTWIQNNHKSVERVVDVVVVVGRIRKRGRRGRKRRKGRRKIQIGGKEKTTSSFEEKVFEGVVGVERERVGDGEEFLPSEDRTLCFDDFPLFQSYCTQSVFHVTLTLLKATLGSIVVEEGFECVHSFVV